MIRTRRGLLGTTLLVAACASAEPAYFTLGGVPGTPRPGVARSIELRRVGLAGYLDRASIVRANVDYRLQVASGERWGEPLTELISRVLAANLAQRLPASTVVQESASLGVETELIAEVDVQRLDSDASGQVVLVAQMSVRPRRGEPGYARTLRFAVSPAGPATGALVAAMSVALGMLADAMAAAVAGA